MLVTMTDKELSRINIIQSVIEKRMRRRDAAHQLALTECQTQRLIDDLRSEKPAPLNLDLQHMALRFTFHASTSG